MTALEHALVALARFLKIISDRPKDREDIAAVVRRQAGRLDRPYLSRTVRALARALDRPDLVTFLNACFRPHHR